MSLSKSLAAVGQPIAYYPRLARFFGSVTAALFFGQLHYWQLRSSSDLGVFKTSDEWTDETGLTYREQATARKQLVERGYLVETSKRLEHRIYYRLDMARVDADFEDWQHGLELAEACAETVKTAACAPVVSRSTKAQLPNDENAIRELRFPQVDSSTEITAKSNTPHTPQGGTPGLSVVSSSPVVVAAVAGIDAPQAAEAVRGTDQPQQPLPSRHGVEIGTWLAACKAEGVKPIPEADPVWAYAERTGIPEAFVALAWAEFKRRRLASGKRQRNWPQTFRNAVEGNWLRLWWTDGATYSLTTQGQQAQALHREARAEREQQQHQQQQQQQRRPDAGMSLEDAA